MQPMTERAGGGGRAPLSLEPPPPEDSEDLTDVEVAHAVPTTDRRDLAHRIATALRISGPEFSLKGHELRRRKPHLYWRVRLVSAEEPDRVLVFRADWLGDRTHERLHR